VLPALFSPVLWTVAANLHNWRSSQVPVLLPVSTVVPLPIRVTTPVPEITAGLDDQLVPFPEWKQCILITWFRPRRCQTTSPAADPSARQNSSGFPNRYSKTRISHSFVASVLEMA
jgi:hypothetical protein